MKNLVGTTLGKYSLVSRIGSGGMGTVFKAHQPRLDRYVAIKVLHSHLAEEPTFVSRFEREAVAIARLNHPNIVKIYDFDADDGLFFMVMELLQGPTLKAELHTRREQNKSLETREIIKITQPLLTALGYAHNAGVVHRDIKPSNVILTQEGHIVLTDFGLARILDASQVTQSGATSGTPEYMSPEQARGETVDERSDLYSLGVMLYEMATGRLPFTGETSFAVITNRLTADPIPPSEYVPSLLPFLEQVIMTALSRDLENRYQTADEMNLALRQVLEQGSISTTPIAVLAPPPEIDEGTASDVSSKITPPRPYRGLFAFREEDAPYFFGRELFTERLLTALREHSLAAVVGPSGSGKSSVVFAGLLPRLRADTHNDQENSWMVASFRPGSRPFQALADALTPLLEPNLSEVDRLVETQKMAQALNSGILTLADVSERVLHKTDGAQHLLLVADQFEEIYTLCSEADTRHRFIRLILQGISQAKQPSPLALVLTLRADFISQALEDRLLAEALQISEVKLGPMTREELTHAVEMPASQMGVTFEPGLIERIINDVEGEPGNLPLLEFALTLMWDRRAGKRLTHAAYEAIGRVEGALARYAERVFARLSEDDKLLARRVFIQMVRPGSHTEDTRRRASRAELGEDAWNMVQRLADERLVTTSLDASGAEVSEVIHEVLIRGWSRLQDWMASDREFRAWQERLRASLQQWEAGKKDESALLRGTLLTEARDWLAARRQDISPTEQQYIQASLELNEREVAEREAQRQRELEAAQKLAQEQQQRAEEQATAARKLRGRAWLLTGMFAVAAVLAVLAFVFAGQANTNARLALARQLAAQSAPLIEDQEDLALLFSLEANRLADLPETRSSLLTVLQETQPRATLLWGHTGNVQATAFSPDGHHLATVGAAGIVLLWTVDYPDSGPLSIQPLGEPLRGHDEQQLVNCVAFSPDGSQIITGSDDGTARLWDVQTGQLLLTLESTIDGDFVQTAVFLADGNTAVLGGGGTLRIWDLGSNQATSLSNQQLNIIWGLSLSPDGTRLAVGSRDQTVTLWDMQTRGIITTTLPTGNEVVNLAFNNDGSLLAVANNSSIVRLLNGETGETLSVLTTTADYVGNVLFLNDQVLLARATTGEISSWDITTGDQLDLYLEAKPNSLQPMALSPDGRLLVTPNGYGVVEVWDLSGELWLGQQMPTSHASGLSSVAYHPGGQMAVSGDYGGLIFRFDPTNGQSLGEPFILTWPGVTPIADLALDPTGSKLVIARTDGTSTLLDLASGETNNLGWSNQTGDITLVYRSDSNWVSKGGSNGRVVTVHAQWGYSMLMTAHEGPVTGLSLLLPWGMVSSGEDGFMRTWAVDGGTIILDDEILAHEDGVSTLAVSPQQSLAATSGFAGGVRLWSLATIELLLDAPTAHQGQVLVLAFAQSEQGFGLYSIGEDGRVLYWELGSEDEPLFDAIPVEILAFDPGVISANLAFDRVVLGYSNGNVVTASLLEPAAPPQKVHIGNTAITAVTLSPTSLFAGGQDGSLHSSPLADLTQPNDPTIIDMGNDMVEIILLQIESAPIGVVKLRFSPDGKILASSGINGAIFLIDAETGELLRSPLQGHLTYVDAMAFSPDGKTLVTGSCSHLTIGMINTECDQGEIILWDVDSGTERARINTMASFVYGLDISPDGKVLAAGGCKIMEGLGNCIQGQVLLWDLDTLQPLDVSFSEHAYTVSELAFSPDGHTVASISLSEMLLWDVRTGQQIGAGMFEPNARAYGLAFSPDGTLLASSWHATNSDGSSNGQIILWDVASGQRIGNPITGSSQDIVSLAFSPDGNTLLFGDYYGVVIAWDLHLDSWRALACQIANRNLSQEEWAQIFGESAYQETCPGLTNNP